MGHNVINNLNEECIIFVGIKQYNNNIIFKIMRKQSNM